MCCLPIAVGCASLMFVDVWCVDWSGVRCALLVMRCVVDVSMRCVLCVVFVVCCLLVWCSVCAVRCALRVVARCVLCVVCSS